MHEVSSHRPRTTAVVCLRKKSTEADPKACFYDAAELAKPEAVEVRILWASRTQADTFWLDQLDALKLQHGNRFSYVEIISRDPGYAEHVGALQGRITADVLRAVYDEHWGTSVSGPNEEARGGVRFLNVAEKQLIKEADKLWQFELGYPQQAHKLLL
jgi:hypothetical protein